MGSVFLSFALGCSHLPKNSILSTKRQFSAHFSNCSNSLNFEAKINCNTTKPNVPKWRKRCTGLKLDLVPFNGPQMQFLSDHNFEGPCRSFDCIWHSTTFKQVSSLYSNRFVTIMFQSKNFNQRHVACRHVSCGRMLAKYYLSKWRGVEVINKLQNISRPMIGSYPP